MGNRREPGGVAPRTLVSMVREAGDLAAVLGCSVVSSAALRTAYRHTPVALVHPLARSAPLLIALLGVIVLGGRLSRLGWAGIVG